MSQAKLRRKKRSRYEIIHDVLDQCQTGSKKTWVMYRANLSYDLTTGYLNELEKMGLVESKDGLYYITEKGKQLLELLRAWRQKKAELVEVTKKIKEILPEEGKKREKKNGEQPKEGTNQASNLAPQQVPAQAPTQVAPAN
ncbi:MAG: winged helix-turn-helix domain-containing protein [Thermofilum sp.]|uniref:winged helix-turn-helix domain-containing protein n=1 Tax=Thermofilum sp. TaxID=1961369 RepID=UPI00258EA573|nr:winged helix-turn-helix domain-containing protein [Thermofilum sp.]MCI4407557.1 winged helix-turn-helix domain-containing protein [Thermofilum sp.]